MQEHADANEIRDEKQSRFDYVKGHTFGAKREATYKTRDIYAKASETIEEIFTLTFSPNGVSGRARRVYEILLRPEIDVAVSQGIAEAAGRHRFDITAIEVRINDEDEEQTALLLEPADTDKYPRWGSDN